MFNEIQGKFYIRIEDRFESSHYLYKYYSDGRDEEIHGHSWKIEIYIASLYNINEQGISFDFVQLKEKLKKLCTELDHRLINTHEDFVGYNPTAEHIAVWFYKNLQSDVLKTDGRIQKIVIYEGPENIAYFEPD